MNRFCLLSSLLFLTLACKERNSLEVNTTIDHSALKTTSRSDFHPHIDLILARTYPNSSKGYYVEVLIDTAYYPQLKYYPADLDERLKDSSKINLLKSFSKEVSVFELDTSKLNAKSKERLKQLPDQEYKMQILFKGFLKSEESNLVATAIIIDNPQGGAYEELVIFENENGIWKISNQIPTVIID